MKTLITFLVLALLPFGVLAKEVPQDATIKVFDKNGKEIGSMSRKEYKVVKIEEPKKTVRVAIPDNFGLEEAAYNEGFAEGAEHVSNAQRSKVRYSAILTGGSGYNGVDVSNNGAAFIVKEKRIAVGQATLCASKNRLGLCGTAATNKFYGLGIKFDFN